MSALSNIRVLELGQLIAGPFCGQVLADFGAEVIKIEAPGNGDPMRQWGQVDEDGNHLWWPVVARNKKSLTLDLRQPEGQVVLRELAAASDVIVENFRPGTMERWGLGWETLESINPRLIMARVSGFGQTGPYSHRAGYASVCEAMGGLRYVSGYPDRPPVRVGISLGDSLAGLNAALGVLISLHERQHSGKGQVVDSAIYEAVLGVMESLITDFSGAGYIRKRVGSILPGVAPSNAYPCGDGRDIIIGANQDSVFARLCKVMGQPELATDPRYVNHQSRGNNQSELDEIISAWTRQYKSEDLGEMLESAGVPAGPVYQAPDLLKDPHFLARESIVEGPHTGGKTLRMQNVFPRLSRTPGEVHDSAPQLGEHTEAVLRDLLEYDEDAIKSLRKRGVI